MKTNSSALIIPAPPATTNAAAGDIREIKAPVDIPAGWLWLWCVLVAIVVAALAFFAWRWWRKKHAGSNGLQIVVPPHERARRKLREALNLIYDSRMFCIEVSDVLRAYLDEAFSLRAPERTTEEFLGEQQSSATLSLSQKQTLAGFLMRCDLVKFARDEPPVEQLKELQESALRLVDETSYFQPPREAVESPADQPPASPPALPPSLPDSGAVQGDPSGQTSLVSDRSTSTV